MDEHEEPSDHAIQPVPVDDSRDTCSVCETERQYHTRMIHPFAETDESLARRFGLSTLPPAPLASSLAPFGGYQS